jgi:hypothetical protein
MILFSLPSFLIVSTSFLPDIFMLFFSYLYFYFYMLFIQTDNKKYFLYQAITIFILGGIREYYIVLIFLTLVHLLWINKFNLRLLIQFLLLSLFSLVFYYVILPYFFSVDYFEIRFHNLTKLGINKEGLDRFGILWGAFLFNYNVLKLRMH